MVALQEFSAKEWVKTRSSLDGEATFLTWNVSIYSFVPNEPKKRLFKIVGMSASRCIADGEGSWQFTSRELTYYLDSNSGEILHKWENPWTGEIVNVAHVANNPVQGYFKGVFPAKVEGEISTFQFDLFPNYPNPLAGDPRFVDYSPNPYYQAAELFKLTVSTAELLNPEIVSVSQVILGWDRIGPWLPWMKMGDRPGQMIYSATGSKVKNWTELPDLLRDEISTRIPLFKDAPKSQLDVEDMTSWLYFQQNFDAYLAGERFPLPAPE
ncbi:MAG: DUF1838 domain-containing protein [Oscillatoriaceae cyanobacterium Prado104]|jgi:hypothetical protein|nr:DUF1838 domain-containing protein [Oscillatoriaceae cyanobacterium Prado104]